MIFSGLTIKAKVGITMLALAVLMTVIGVLGLVGMSSADRAFADVHGNKMPGMLSASSANLLVARERLNFDRAVMEIGTPGAQTAAEKGKVFRARADKALKAYENLPNAQGEAVFEHKVRETYDAHQRLLDEGWAGVQKGDEAKAKQVAADLTVRFNDYAQANEALFAFQQKASDADYDASASRYLATRNGSIVAILVGVALAIYSWLALRRAIGAPLASALSHFQAIANGDLTQRVDIHSRDEMGQLLQGLATMKTGLAETVRSVRVGSDAIALATGEISAGNADLSSRTEEQASALQQTAASMEELTGTVRQNADNAKQASSLAATASDIASRGNRVVGQVVETMSGINQSSSKIADIITIIEGISFQTNILALNAAVEAARAGEQGRGFAVVAGEVRTLAQRSSAAAKEIKELIDASVSRVKSGTVLVDDAGRTMTEIIGAVQRVTDIMGEIAAASQEQSNGIDQVAQAVGQMDDATQRNAALVEQSAAAAQSLEDQAEKLRQTVSVFRVA
jgi:methyl-accepting chemotaxis protein-1 (serine sensor receptor)